MFHFFPSGCEGQPLAELPPLFFKSPEQGKPRAAHAQAWALPFQARQRSDNEYATLIIEKCPDNRSPRTCSPPPTPPLLRSSNHPLVLFLRLRFSHRLFFSLPLHNNSNKWYNPHMLILFHKRGLRASKLRRLRATFPSLRCNPAPPFALRTPAPCRPSWQLPFHLFCLSTADRGTA